MPDNTGDTTVEFSSLYYGVQPGVLYIPRLGSRADHHTGFPQPHSSICVLLSIACQPNHIADMRLRSQMLHVFLAMLLVITSIAEASRKRKKDGNGDQSKKRKLTPSSTLIDSSGFGGEVPIQRHSGPRLGLDEARGDKTNVGEASSIVEGSRWDIVPFSGPKSVTSSGDVLKDEFVRAVDGEGLGWLNTNWERWEERRDLLDYMVTMSVVVTIWVIQNVKSAKRPVLAALFGKEEGIINGVLKKVGYNDDDLCDLTEYRPELAGLPKKFFNVLDRMEEPEMQEKAVQAGIFNLIKTGKHNSVVPLIDAWKRVFKSEILKDMAIQWAFYKGAEKGHQDIVEEYQEHPSDHITEIWSWIECILEQGQPKSSLSLLLEQARRSLMRARKEHAYGWYEVLSGH